MPNTGKPSKDCHLCRKRRVKCDLGQPECQRCLRLGKKCPGYRDEIDLMFRHEDMSTYETNSNRDRRRARTDSSRPSSLKSASPVATGPSFSLDGLSHRRLFEGATRLSHGVWKFGTSLNGIDSLISSPAWSPPAQGETLEDIAVALTLGLFSGPTGEYREFGVVDFLPSMLAESHEGSPLVLSCHAIALAYLSNKSGQDEIKAYRTEAYGRALAATNSLLNDQELCKEDEACVCVYLLSIYEIIIGSPKSNRIPGPVTWSIHTQGIVELLKMRGPKQLQNQRTRDIFWKLSRSIQMHALMAGIACPDFFYEWLTDNEEDIPQNEQDYRLLYLFGYDAAALCSTIRHSIEVGSTSLLSPESDIFEAAERLDNRVTAILANDPLQSPISLHQVSIHNLYRSIHIKVQSSLLELLDSPLVGGFNPQGLIPTLRRQCLQVLRDLTDATLETMSYVIGPNPSNSPTSSPSRLPQLQRPRAWSDALNAFWSLRSIVSSASFVRTKQQEVVEAKLKRIATEFYIRQAVGAYYTNATYRLTQSFGQEQNTTSPVAPILIAPEPKDLWLGSPSNVRDRRFGPREKSVQYCVTCEGRKVICDGDRPECLRCRSQGYECKGYPDYYESILPFRFSSDTQSSSESVSGMC